MGQERNIRTLSGTVTNIDTTFIELVVHAGFQKKICIHRVVVERTGGSATTFQPQLCNADAGSGVEQLVLGASTAVATLFDVTDIAAWGVTDANGSIWLGFTPDAGADNDFNYTIILESF